MAKYAIEITAKIKIKDTVEVVGSEMLRTVDGTKEMLIDVLRPYVEKESVIEIEEFSLDQREISNEN